MFYEIGTDHGLPYDPFKVSGFNSYLLILAVMFCVYHGIAKATICQRVVITQWK
jgi:hypothetical protein